MRMRVRWFFAIIFLAALCCSVPGQTVKAQEPVRKDAGAAQPRAEEKNPNEAASKETGPAEEMKNAPAVRWIARKTGLSNAAAYWISVVLNFAIIVAFLAWVYKKTAPGFFRNRNESIQRRIEEARKTSEEARRRLTEVEGRLSRLDSEIAEMRRQADESAQTEEQRIQVEVEQERRRILAAAEQEIAAAAGAARRELKAYAGELAINLAAQRIKVGKDTDQMLVRDFTAQLGKDGN
jgi:F-type H+-transporting ATPase subunit b